MLIAIGEIESELYAKNTVSSGGSMRRRSMLKCVPIFSSSKKKWTKKSQLLQVEFIIFCLRAIICIASGCWKRRTGVALRFQ